MGLLHLKGGFQTKEGRLQDLNTRREAGSFKA